MSIFSKLMATIVGSFTLAIGINCFLIPYEVLDGGVIGLGLIVKYLWHVQAGIAIIAFSLPIFIMSWFKEKNYFFSSIHGLLISSFFIDLLQPLQTIIQANKLFNAPINAIVGGILVGLGIGLMLRYGTSTGGTDLLAQFLSRIIHVNMGVIIFVIDLIVVGIGGLVISSQTFFLSILTITTAGFTTSLCTWGMED